MQTEARWTLDELVRRVAAALAGGAYPGSPNGRVRDLPDRRVVRWYATIGLIDRPAGTHGRTALYGPRHLLQLVAVKRRQAEGRALADIQAELTGATDATLRRIAGVSDELLVAGVSDELLAATVPTQGHPTQGPTQTGGPAAVRARFWTGRVAATPEPADGVTTLTGVPLGMGVLLLLAAQPASDDLGAIRAAAEPLLDLLTERGLFAPTAPSTTIPGSRT